MKSIKTYLLSLFLLVFFGAQVFSQTSIEKSVTFSKADSLLVATYLTESDYNEKHGVMINPVCEVGVVEDFYPDEVYNEEPNNRNNSRNRFLDAGTVEFIVDVAIHTIFLITAFWQ
jgi:hypothetical protein